MSLTSETDYVFCPSATYIGSVGAGQGCLVGTRKCLLGLPERIDSGVWNHSVTVTTYSVDGLTPGDAIRKLTEQDDITIDQFDETLKSLGQNWDAAVFVDFNEQHRLKVRAGLCTKGIYWSDRPSGPGWKGYGLGSKELTEKWIQFYADHEKSV